MSRGHQIFIATGHLGDDPVVKAPQSGGLVAEFRIAVTDRWKDKQGNRIEHTEWLRIKVFGRTAEIVQQYLTKGSLVTIEGKIRTEKWQGQDGSDRYSQWIYADEMHMHGGREEATTQREHQGRPKPAESTTAPAPKANSLMTTSRSNHIITVPVLDSFKSNQVIGTLSINASKLPPAPDFAFVLGFQAQATDAPGTIPTKPHAGPYNLVSVAIATDKEYLAYLQQIGVDQSTGVDAIVDTREARG